MCICKQRVPGYQRLWERNSQFLRIASDFACNLQGAKRLLAPALLYSLACLPQLGLLNTTAWAASPPLFFLFYHIIRTTSALLASCYHPRCRHQPHRHPHQYRTHHVLLDVIHAAGILFSSTLYSSCLDVIHAAGILFSSSSYSLRRIVQLPTVPVRAALTIHEARRPSRLVIFAIIFAAGSLTAIFIDIVLIASCLIRQTAFVSVTQSYAVYGDVELCCLR